MAFNLKIKNLGKLTDATIQIGQFTVFAGPNNTGKSFVSKILYSLFDAMNVNPVEVHIKNLTDPLLGNLQELEMFFYSCDPDDISLGTLHDEVAALKKLVIESSTYDFEKLDKIVSDLTDKSKVIQEKSDDVFSHLRSFTEKKIEDVYSPLSMTDLKECIAAIKKSLNALQEGFTCVDAKQLIVSGIENRTRENLLKNFQVSNFSDLRGEEDVPSAVNIEGFVEFKFPNGRVEFTINPGKSRKLQQSSKEIYPKSPVYWKLKNALESHLIHPRYLLGRRGMVSGIPGYFSDLVSASSDKYTDDIAFPDVYEKLTGKDGIGGKITISDNGDLSFQENGRSFPLSVTAMGVTNLGILALLIERNVLDEDSFLLIDEPETHLHPAWQVVMAECLFELAKGGANVVIATHSADILKWLEVHVKKNPEDEKLIALNKFPANGEQADDQDFSDKIAAINQELTQPFADLYVEGLL